jgi:Transposase IS66 family
MGNGLPEIAPEERTPLVLALLDIIQQQREAIQQLRDEIARLKGQNPKPQIQPSRLEQALPRPPSAEGEKRPGSPKRSKNAELTIHHEVSVPVPNPPAGSVSLSHEPYVVQELVIEVKNTRYWRERIRARNGNTVLAPLPAEVLPGLHFGPTLICFIRHQYHHNHVTQPLLLEQLREFGINISAGQLSRLLTENLDIFHREKEALLPAGLKVSSYVGVDDTGARHQGKTGFCTHIGNELFAYFESTDTKSRLNFLEILRRPHTDYVINDAALAYWRRQKMPAEVLAKLTQQPRAFPDASAWRRRLRKLAITRTWHVRMATEGALLGSLIAHGVSPHLVVLSDGASQFDVLVHASCWVHAERPLARLVPSSEEQRAAVEAVRQQIWELYQDLKAYRQHPEPARQPSLVARFETLVNQRTDFPSINSALKEMRSHQVDLLRVLQRPEVPLHNNTSEAHIRDYVKKRKISGSTRSAAGRRCRDTFASLKKTCRRLGVIFWDYLQDRVRGLNQIPQLADLLRQRIAAFQAA